MPCLVAGVTFAPTTSPPTVTPSSKPTAEPSTAAPTSVRTFLPPAQIFPDLSSFRLQLPLFSSSGRYTTITDLTNYTSSYFYADDVTGAMSFWCPSDGSVVNGSTFPRTTIRSTPFNVTTVPQSSSVQVSAMASVGRCVHECADVDGRTAVSDEPVHDRWCGQRAFTVCDEVCVRACVCAVQRN